MKLSRLLIVILALTTLLGGASAAGAQGIAEGEGTNRYARCVAEIDPSIAYRCETLLPQVLTLVGPNGEQIAAFCYDGEVAFSVRTEGPEAVYFADTPGRIPCFPAAITLFLPGYQVVMNTGPGEGWVIIATGSDWPVVWQCRDGALVNVTMESNGDPALLKHEVTTDCGYVPSPVA